MKWKLLVENCCPKCCKQLHLGQDQVVCLGFGCGFSISSDRMDQICSDIINRRFEDEDDSDE